MALVGTKKGKEGPCFKLIHVNCVFSVPTTDYALGPDADTLSRETRA